MSILEMSTVLVIDSQGQIFRGRSFLFYVSYLLMCLGLNGL